MFRVTDSLLLGLKVEGRFVLFLLTVQELCCNAHNLCPFIKSFEFHTLNFVASKSIYRIEVHIVPEPISGQNQVGAFIDSFRFMLFIDALKRREPIGAHLDWEVELNLLVSGYTELLCLRVYYRKYRVSQVISSQ